VDAIATAVILYFFVIGLGDNTVYGQNAGLWLMMVILPIALLVGTYMLKENGKLKAAKWLLSIMAVPTILFFLFFLIIAVTNPKWN
jgi:hypothetical protein